MGPRGQLNPAPPLLNDCLRTSLQKSDKAGDTGSGARQSVRMAYRHYVEGTQVKPG